MRSVYRQKKKLMKKNGKNDDADVLEKRCINFHNS